MMRRLVPVKDAPIEATVRAPGSKSLTIRSLFVAALANGTSHLGHPLDSGDTRAARGAVRSLGVAVAEMQDRWAVEGRAGVLVAPPGQIDVGESGLTARILIAVGALVPGRTRVVGQGRLPERPMTGLIEALSGMGVRVSSDHGGIPLTVEGTGILPGGNVSVPGEATSQFATAMLIVAPLAREPMTINFERSGGSTGYLDLTLDVMKSFGAHVEKSDDGFNVEPTGYQAAEFEIEPDASAAVYPMVATAIRGGRVTLSGLDDSSRQPDFQITSILAGMGCRISKNSGSTTVESDGGPLRPISVDLSAMPDGALAVAVACLFATGESRLDGLGTLRHKESDRLRALSDQLQNVGGQARIDGDSLLISPGTLRPASVDTYGDHRIAMALSLVGLIQPGIQVGAPEVVDKTWPGFWDMLDAL